MRGNVAPCAATRKEKNSCATGFGGCKKGGFGACRLARTHVFAIPDTLPSVAELVEQDRMLVIDAIC